MIAKSFTNVRKEIIKDIFVVFNCWELIILSTSVQKRGIIKRFGFSVDVIQRFVRSPRVCLASLKLFFDSIAFLIFCILFQKSDATF